MRQRNVKVIDALRNAGYTAHVVMTGTRVIKKGIWLRGGLGYAFVLVLISALASIVVPHDVAAATERAGIGQAVSGSARGAQPRRRTSPVRRYAAETSAERRWRLEAQVSSLGAANQALQQRLRALQTSKGACSGPVFKLARSLRRAPPLPQPVRPSMADLPPTTELEHLNAQRHAARILHRQLARAVEQLDGNQNSRRRQLQAAQWADTSRELIAAAIPLCTGGAELIAYRDGQHDEAGESKANRHQLHNALVRLSRAVGKANGWDWNALQSHRELHGAAHQVLALRAPIYGRRGFTGQWEMLAGMVVRYPDTAPQRAIVCDTLVAKNLSAAFALLRTMRMQIRTWNYPALLLRLPLHKSEEKLARVIANLFGGRITEDGNATVRQDHDVSEPWAGASPEIIYQISAFHPGGDPFLHPALDTDAECWRAD